MANIDLKSITFPGLGNTYNIPTGGGSPGYYGNISYNSSTGVYTLRGVAFKDVYDSMRNGGVVGYRYYDGETSYEYYATGYEHDTGNIYLFFTSISPSQAGTDIFVSTLKTNYPYPSSSTVTSFTATQRSRLIKPAVDIATSIDSTSTNTMAAGAKAVYDALPDISGKVSKTGDTMTGKLTIQGSLNGLQLNYDDTHYASISINGYSGFGTSNYYANVSLASGSPVNRGVYLYGIATPLSTPGYENVAANRQYVDDAITAAIGTAIGGSY